MFAVHSVSDRQPLSPADFYPPQGNVPPVDLELARQLFAAVGRRYLIDDLVLLLEGREETSLARAVAWGYLARIWRGEADQGGPAKRGRLIRPAAETPMSVLFHIAEYAHMGVEDLTNQFERAVYEGRSMDNETVLGMRWHRDRLESLRVFLRGTRCEMDDSRFERIDYLGGSGVCRHDGGVVFQAASMDVWWNELEEYFE